VAELPPGEVHLWAQLEGLFQVRDGQAMSSCCCASAKRPWLDRQMATTDVVITAANGDILYGNGAGTNTMIAPGRIAFRTEVTFTGGTGRFTGASGEAVLEGEADLPSATATLEMTGWEAWSSRTTLRRSATSPGSRDFRRISSTGWLDFPASELSWCTSTWASISHW
jgi:hypothetical protein